MLANFVQETANAPGSATTINLGGPPAGRRGFLAAFASGATVYYFMDDGTQAEWGQGTVTSGTPNTLARTTVIGNTAGTTARLNFTGTVRVYSWLPAERMVELLADAPPSAWTDVASAATTNLGAVNAANLRITGTTTITAFGTAASGARRQLRFAGALVLTHNATSLILPGGANIATAAGDAAVAVSLGGGNWAVVEYTPAALWSWQMLEPPRIVSGVAQVDFALPTAFRRYRLTIHDGSVATAGQGLSLRFSSDGGATFLSAATYQQIGNRTDGAAANAPFATSTATSIALSPALPNTTGNQWDAEFAINPGSALLSARVRGFGIGVDSAPTWAHGYWGGAWGGAVARMNAIRIFAASGNISGTFILEGLR